MRLMDMGQVLRLVCRYPSAAILLQPLFGDNLQSVGMPPKGNIYPCTALIVLNNSPDLAVDAVDFPDELFFAEIPRDFLDAFRDTVYFPL